MAEATQPREIWLFETIQIVFVAYTVIGQFAAGSGQWLTIIVGAAWMLWLTLRVSRRRSRRARNVLAIGYLAGLALGALFWSEIAASPVRAMLYVVIALAQAATIALLFTGSGRAWLEGHDH